MATLGSRKGHSMITSEQLIGHLSKEIEMIMNNAVSFRMRSAFTVWIGPYILLGSVLIVTKGEIVFTFGDSTRDATILAGVTYFCLGVAGGLLERGAWRRCNELRRLIFALSPASSRRTIGTGFQDHKGERLVLPFYIVLFTLIGLSFGAVFYISTSLQSKPVLNPGPALCPPSAQQGAPADVPAVPPGRQGHG